MAIVAYVIYKIGALFFRAGAASQQFRNPTPRNGSGPAPDGKKNDGNIKGGEYIDYEEVK